MKEPKEAFPYRPPSDEIRAKYSHLFSIDEPISERWLKLLFDKAASLILLSLAAPILLLLKIEVNLLTGIVFIKMCQIKLLD